MSSDKISFSHEELARYNRQVIIPGFGLEAQQKLKAAKVLVVGAGGLGCPLLLYLAAAGIGTLGIIDFDTVDESNLHRQVLYGTNDAGKSKAIVAKEKLQSLNPHITINSYNLKLTSQNALTIIREYDVVADGTDNFPTRYLVNDACVLAGKANVFASIFQFEGQVAVFNYVGSNGSRGPNYRDLFPSPPSPNVVPNCAEGGVLGVLPGIIGSMQANEVLKVITGMGEPLSGRLLTYDALTCETRVLKINRTDTNPLNGTNPTIIELIDYNLFCGIDVDDTSIKEISAEEFIQWQNSAEDIQVIDVREPGEYAQVNTGAILLPLNSVIDKAGTIDRNKKVVVLCRSGIRSANAIRQLENRFGFTNLHNLKGGILAYLGHNID